MFIFDRTLQCAHSLIYLQANKVLQLKYNPQNCFTIAFTKYEIVAMIFLSTNQICYLQPESKLEVQLKDCQNSQKGFLLSGHVSEFFWPILTTLSLCFLVIIFIN